MNLESKSLASFRHHCLSAQNMKQLSCEVQRSWYYCGQRDVIVYMQMSLDLYKFIYLTACGMTSTRQQFLFPCKTVGTILHVYSIKGFWYHISENRTKYLSQTKQFLKDVELLIMFSFSPQWYIQWYTRYIYLHYLYSHTDMKKKHLVVIST